MPNSKEPIELILAKGRKHLTDEEIEARRAAEVHAPGDDVRPPDYLSAKQKAEFSELAQQLVELDILGNIDAGELGRYVVAHSMYARYTKLLRTLPKKKTARLRELRAQLARDEGRADDSDDLDDADVVLELEKSLALLQDKFFNQCEQTARALGLNITSRCKLVIPKAPPAPTSGKFDRFKKRGEAVG